MLSLGGLARFIARARSTVSLLDATRAHTGGPAAVEAAVDTARKRYNFSSHGLLTIPLTVVEVWADLTPLVRMRGLRRLPANFGAGVLGAEAATWGAVSPSLLPHRWWVVAANVAICQGVGHAAGVAVSRVRRIALGGVGLAVSPRGTGRAARTASTLLHLGMSAVTVSAFVLSRRRGKRQVELVGVGEYRLRGSLFGIAVGTFGYGALLAIGEALQVIIDLLNLLLGKRLPSVTSWPLAVIGGAGATLLFTDRVVLRNILSRVYRNAQELDREFLPGAPRPREPERSGSPASYESWQSIGRQGRAVVAGGPRTRDIEQVLGIPGQGAEPIRIFIGLGRQRGPEETVRQAMAELDRTDAWSRSHLAVMSAAGTGWINDFHTSGFEFIGRGDTAIVALQYSYLPSAYSYLADHESPVRSARMLIDAIRDRLDALPATRRPKLYIGGESLGAYGVSDAFDSVDDLLGTVSGAVLTGTPGFARIHDELTRGRDTGSPHRLPIVDGGRHARFCAHPDHLGHDYAGRPYTAEWASPRVVFAQHASDPVVWWDWSLAWRAPDWLKEPGSRGVPAPAAQRLDVPDTMRWTPFITFWQVAIDQLSSQDCPSPHGHNYHDETVSYWAAVMRSDLDAATLHRISLWIHRDATKLRRPAVMTQRRFNY
ncbi:alpha/beta-hydrolase family protein [Corynebacterium sp. LK2510]|uniref:alpha/beta-hydrolase family protein n=1 Tax=Corynebacterium sp. LK2510 TaxID=3110472 RepID=UPI0034CF7E67